MNKIYIHWKADPDQEKITRQQIQNLVSGIILVQNCGRAIFVIANDTQVA